MGATGKILISTVDIKRYDRYEVVGSMGQDIVREQLHEMELWRFSLVALSVGQRYLVWGGLRCGIV